MRRRSKSRASDKNSWQGEGGAAADGGAERRAEQRNPGWTTPRSAPNSSHLSRFENHLDTVVLFVAEGAVRLRRLLQRLPVQDDEARVDVALLHALQQRPYVAVHVRLAGLDGQTLVHGHPKRD